MPDTNIGSVQISLDIEVGSSTEKQVASVSDRVSQKLKSSIEKNFSKDNLSRGIGKTLSSIVKQGTSAGEKIGKNIADGIKKASGKAFEKRSVAQVVNNASSVSSPKVKSGVTLDDLTNQRDNSIAMQENLNAQIYELQKQLSNKIDMQRKGVVTEEMLKLENRIISLKSKSDSLTPSITNLDNAIESLNTSETAKDTGDLANQTDKLGLSFRNVEKASKKAKRPLVNIGGVTRSLMRQFLGISLLIRTVGTSVRRFFQNITASLKSNKEFSKSLDQIKSNLATAFQPIYEAILPAINSLMSIISKATAYLAAFISMLFGKSVKASNANAKALDNAKKSAEGYGKAMNKIAGFDQLNDMTEDSGGGGSGGIGAINLDEKELSGIQSIVDKIKGYFSGLTDFIEQNKVTVISMLAGIGAALATAFIIPKAVAFIGTITKIVGWIKNFLTVAKSLGVFKTIALGLNAAFGPLAATIAVVATVVGLVVAAIAQLWQTNEGFRTSIITAWEGIKETISNIWNSILKPVLDSMVAMFKNIWQYGVKPLWDGWVEFVRSVVMIMTELWNDTLKPLVDWFVAKYGPLITDVLDLVSRVVAFVFSAMGQQIGLFFKNVSVIVDNLIGIFKGVVTFLKGIFANDWGMALDGVKQIFEGFCKIISGVFQNTWNFILGLFNSGGKIFDGIVGGITNIFKTIVNGIISGLNKVISVPFNGINGILNTIRNLDIPFVGKPFAGLWGQNPMPVPQIPMLAGGGVLKKPTLNIAGEYPGANSNPEIVAPQNIMADTFRSVLSEFMNAFKESGNVSSEMIHLVVNIGGKQLLDTMIDSAKDYGRQTGKEVTFNV
jgi:hypothetical protein